MQVMFLSPAVQVLVDALRILPGVGPKSAQRMALHLLERNRAGGMRLAESLMNAMSTIKSCQSCQNFTEQDICSVCQDQTRDQRVLCVVEQPVDMLAIESSRSYKGRYFVLKGHLSPLDGIGPKELGIPLLLEQLKKNLPDELILATNPTVEGEATAHYIKESLSNIHITISRIAHGVPMGGEIEFVDGNTLAHALGDRKRMS